MIWQIGYQAGLDPSEVMHLLAAAKTNSSSSSAATTAAAVTIAMAIIAIIIIPISIKSSVIAAIFICFEATNSTLEQFVETGQLFYPLYRHPAKVGKLFKNYSMIIFTFYRNLCKFYVSHKI